MKDTHVIHTDENIYPQTRHAFDQLNHARHALQDASAAAPAAAVAR